jgi:hypothetical protein
MTDIVAPKAATNSRRGASATLGHIRYVLAGNPVTAFAALLFGCIALLSLLGPWIAPYDPLASHTSEALKPPSASHWFGTDQLGRDVFSRVIVATRLDLFIALASVGLVFLMGGLAGVAAGFFWRLDRQDRRPHRRYNHGLPALRAGDGHRCGAWQYRWQHHLGHGDRELPTLCPSSAGRGP